MRKVDCLPQSSHLKPRAILCLSQAPTAGDGESAPAIASPALTEEEQEERALRLAARFSQVRTTDTESNWPQLSLLLSVYLTETSVPPAFPHYQAVAELQFIGVCRPNKRRKAASTMQRMFYPPESMFA